MRTVGAGASLGWGTPSHCHTPLQQRACMGAGSQWWTGGPGARPPGLQSWPHRSLAMRLWASRFPSEGNEFMGKGSVKMSYRYYILGGGAGCEGAHSLVFTTCAPTGSGGCHEAATLAATAVQPWSTAETCFALAVQHEQQVLPLSRGTLMGQPGRRTGTRPGGSAPEGTQAGAEPVATWWPPPR